MISPLNFPENRQNSTDSSCLLECYTEMDNNIDDCVRRSFLWTTFILNIYQYNYTRISGIRHPQDISQARLST